MVLVVVVVVVVVVEEKITRGIEPCTLKGKTKRTGQTHCSTAAPSDWTYGMPCVGVKW